MKKSKSDKYGVCRLTGESGKFVKSHIIPRAFTKAEVAGDPIWQAGLGKSITKRFDSWYDQKLCTRHGEDILSLIDGAAISELRRHKLVWSGWDGERLTSSDHTQIGNTPLGARKIEGLNVRLIRRFFLSLLWRAAASQLWEFAEVQIPDADVEQLRELVLSGEPGPIDFYPISLTQLSTKGPSHNLTPIVMPKNMLSIEGSEAWSVEIIRFYFEGLIAHVHKHARDDGKTAATGNLVVGGGPDLLLTTVTFEASFQLKNISEIMENYIDPDDAD